LSVWLCWSAFLSPALYLRISSRRRCITAARIVKTSTPSGGRTAASAASRFLDRAFLADQFISVSSAGVSAGLLRLGAAEADRHVATALWAKFNRARDSSSLVGRSLTAADAESRDRGSETSHTLTRQTGGRTAASAASRFLDPACSLIHPDAIVRNSGCAGRTLCF
jgi:hypothetical protein